MKLTGTMTLTYEVDCTRDEAIEWLVDAGEDEAEVIALSDADLAKKLIDTDEVRWQLDDVSVETDSSETEWEIVT